MMRQLRLALAYAFLVPMFCGMAVATRPAEVSAAPLPGKQRADDEKAAAESSQKGALEWQGLYGVRKGEALAQRKTNDDYYKQVAQYNMTQAQKDAYAAKMSAGDIAINIGAEADKATAEQFLTNGDLEKGDGDDCYIAEQWGDAVGWYGDAQVSYANACQNYAWGIEDLLYAKARYLEAWNLMP